MADHGPSKGYSIPRRDAEGSSDPYCQNCSSTEHWTYQCKIVAETEKRSSARLSASQLLRLGLKRKRNEVVPEPTEREKFQEELKNIEAEIAEQIKQEKLLEAEKESLKDAVEVKSEEKTSSNTGKKRVSNELLPVVKKE